MDSPETWRWAWAAAVTVFGVGEPAATRSVHTAIHDGGPDAGLVTIEYLEALAAMAEGQGTKIIVPTGLSGIAGALTALVGGGGAPQATPPATEAG